MAIKINKACPSCKKIITRFTISAALSNDRFGGQGHKVICHCCPECNVVLGVEIDPITLKAEIVAEIKKAIGR